MSPQLWWRMTMLCMADLLCEAGKEVGMDVCGGGHARSVDSAGSQPTHQALGQRNHVGGNVLLAVARDFAGEQLAIDVHGGVAVGSHAQLRHCMIEGEGSAW